MKKKGKGGDCKMTGAAMKGDSRSAGVTKAKHSAVDSFGVGYTYSRKSVKGKK